jgi:hypothetical protein
MPIARTMAVGFVYLEHHQHLASVDLLYNNSMVTPYNDACQVPIRTMSYGSAVYYQWAGAPHFKPFSTSARLHMIPCFLHKHAATRQALRQVSFLLASH